MIDFKKIFVSVSGTEPVSKLAARYFKGVRVIAFHKVHNPSRFEAILKYITSEYQVISASQWLDSEHQLPDNALIITFDDGDDSVVEYALPLLVKYHVPATMFVCPGIVSGKGYFWVDVVNTAIIEGSFVSEFRHKTGIKYFRPFLKTIPDTQRRIEIQQLESRLSSRIAPHVADVQQLRVWIAAGMELGNHTWDHPCLDQCDLEEQRQQVLRAHHWFINELNIHPALFAYPNGDYTPETEQILIEMGYKGAFLFNHSIANSRENIFRISRLRLDADAPLNRVRSVISGSHSFLFAKSGIAKQINKISSS